MATGVLKGVMARPGLALRGLALPLAAAALIALSACGDDDAPVVTPTAATAASPAPIPAAAPSLTATATPGPAPAAAPALTVPQSLASGEFRLPAAGGFGQPGFHEVLVATHALPPSVDMAGGLRLVLKLWDAGRTQQTCSRDHPLSGCATVDWSDFESRQKVPPGGVFENSLTVQLASGPHTFFLTEDGELNDEPNKYAPG